MNKINHQILCIFLDYIYVTNQVSPSSEVLPEKHEFLNPPTECPLFTRLESSSPPQSKALLVLLDPEDENNVNLR